MTVGKVYRHRPGEHLYCSGKRLWPHRIAAILAARMRAGWSRSLAELVIRRKSAERGHLGRTDAGRRPAFPRFAIRRKKVTHNRKAVTI